MADEEKDIDEIDEDEDLDGEDPENEDDDDDDDDDGDDEDEEIAVTMDDAVAHKMATGYFSYGDGFELKSAIFPNKPESQDDINDLFNEKDGKGLGVVRSVIDVIVSEKTILIWYYE